MFDEKSKQLLESKIAAAGIVCDGDWVHVAGVQYIRCGQRAREGRAGAPVILEHLLGRDSVFVFGLEEQIYLGDWTTAPPPPETPETH